MERKVVHEVTGLQNCIWYSGLYESLFDIALAVVLKDLAELGVEDRREDEVLDFMVNSGLNHVFSGRRKSAQR